MEDRVCLKAMVVMVSKNNFYFLKKENRAPQLWSWKVVLNQLPVDGGTN